MAVARFLFVPGVPAGEPASPRWPAEWSVANGFGWTFAGTTIARSDARYAWRLLGANNRELGRSSAVYASLDACRAAVAELKAHAATADVLLAVNDLTGLWTWRLDISGRWVAVAGRAYQRRRECQYNVAQFQAAASTAQTSNVIVARTRVRGIRHEEAIS